MTHADSVDANGLELLGKILEQLTLIAGQMGREDKSADRLLSPDETAQYLGVRPDTLAIWRHRSTGPKYHKVGSIVRYRRSDLEEFLKSREVGR